MAGTNCIPRGRPRLHAVIIVLPQPQRRQVLQRAAARVGACARAREYAYSLARREEARHCSEMQ